MLLSALLLCVVAFSAAIPTRDPTDQNGEKCGYRSCTPTHPDKLNVHIVPHTHDDVGWLKTVDQYYFGSRNNIQKAGVEYILDSVVSELWKNPKRRFIYVETAFFWKWWTRQSPVVRNRVHVMVRQGRLKFVGGAWSMNDEAAVHYQSTIDQFTWGLKKLNDTFGECGIPVVGWQIDPFGHSREFASLLAGMGYDGLFLGRIDYQDKSTRLQNKHMEMVWRGDDALGKPSDIFTGILYNTYSPPPGFCFDILCSDEPIIDDPGSPMFNVEKRVEDFLETCRNMSKGYKTNNILITMGEDFNYQIASMWFENLDKLIQYGNLMAAKKNLNITLFYSTPDCYLKAVKDANPTLPTKQDDFFPYASDPHAYWTGYFTSRPTTKYFEREGNNYLQVAKQLQVLGNLKEHNMFMLNELKSVMGVMQHHDAITGTEKEHVTHDYERMLHRAVEDSLLIPREAINMMTQGTELKAPILNMDNCRFNESSCLTSERADNLVVTIYNPLAWEVTEPIRIPVLLNTDESYEVYNPNGEKIVSQIIPISTPVKNIPTRKSDANHEVIIQPTLDPLGYISFFMKKINKKSLKKRDLRYKTFDAETFYAVNNYWQDIKEKAFDEIRNTNDDVHIYKQIPDEPSFTVYDKVKNNNVDIKVLKDNDETVNQDVEEFEKLLREERRNMQIDRRVGRDNAYTKLNEDELRMLSDEPRIVEVYPYNEEEKIPQFVIEDGQMTYNYKGISIGLEFYYYPGCIGNNEIYANRSSGAYIFRPNGTQPHKVAYDMQGQFIGPIVKEFRAEEKDFALSVRMYDNYFEQDIIIGPIDISDNIGKEYVARYKTNVKTNGQFYTDANGRQLLKRIIDKRPQYNLNLSEPISGNYYPVTTIASIIENDKSQLTVITDRSEGAGSLGDGQLELMLHRRLLHDDAFGVDEALNETAMGVGLVTRITHRVLSNLMAAGHNKTKFALQMSLHPRVFVSDAKDLQFDAWLKLNNRYSWLKKPLPEAVHLLTLEPHEKDILLRLENIIEEPNTVIVDLGDLFKNINVKGIRETTLAANRYLDDVSKWVWNTENKFYRSFNEAYGNENETPYAGDDDINNEDEGLKISLKSKQIRTFIVQYDYVKE